MDSYQFNKIAGALLATLFVVLGLTFLSDAIFANREPETPGFAIAVATQKKDTAEAKAPPIVESVDDLLATVNLDAGLKVAKKCAACHTFDKGGKKKIGPNLFEIVNRPIASVDGFSYSVAMKKFGSGKSWTYEELSQFLFKPKAYIKGTSMSFAGLKKLPDRAAIVFYLRSLADTPAALPDG